MSRGGITTTGDAAFADGACRLSGSVCALFGWSPDAFWRSTPAEVAAVVAALAGEREAPPDDATIERLRKAFPDGR